MAKNQRVTEGQRAGRGEALFLSRFCLESTRARPHLELASAGTFNPFVS